MIVKLPFPDATMFPNRKNGRFWAATNKIKELQKDEAYWLTKKAGKFVEPEGNIPLSLLFLTPDKRHRDTDNMLAAAKHILDGMAEALGVNDKRFKPLLVDWAHGGDKIGSLVVAVNVHVVSYQEMP